MYSNNNNNNNNNDNNNKYQTLPRKTFFQEFNQQFSKIKVLL